MCDNNKYDVDDGAYVQAVYGAVLGRTGDPNEIATWVSALSQRSRTDLVNALLGSVEYRRLVVRQDYTTVLGRLMSPSASEVAGWVNSGLDLRTFEGALAASSEFYTNG